jgi:hypothetical protein
MMSTGYESTASHVSQSSKSHRAFYSKIKEQKSAPVREILERFYEGERYVIKAGETRETQSERVQELMSELESQYQMIH